MSLVVGLAEGVRDELHNASTDDIAAGRDEPRGRPSAPPMLELPRAPGRGPMAVALLGCWLGYGFVLALLVAFLLPLRLASHVGEFTLWAGPFAAVVVVIAAFATRRRRRSDDWWLARVGLFTLWFGPAVWLALFAGRLA